MGGGRIHVPIKLQLDPDPDIGQGQVQEPVDLIQRVFIIGLWFLLMFSDVFVRATDTDPVKSADQISVNRL